MRFPFFSANRLHVSYSLTGILPQALITEYQKRENPIAFAYNDNRSNYKLSFYRLSRINATNAGKRYSQLFSIPQDSPLLETYNVLYAIINGNNIPAVIDTLIDTEEHEYLAIPNDFGTARTFDKIFHSDINQERINFLKSYTDYKYGKVQTNYVFQKEDDN